MTKNLKYFKASLPGYFKVSMLVNDIIKIIMT